MRVTACLVVLLWGLVVAYDSQKEKDEEDEISKLTEDFELLEEPMPVLLLPGFASSRLRAYSSTKCPVHISLSKYPLFMAEGNMLRFDLNDDVWLDVAMVLGAKWCFLHCMSLNPVNQSDPTHPRCRIRPDQGLDAISQLNPGVVTGPLSVVWKRLIDLLLNMGFIPEKTLLVAPYDFRLAPMQLESRDHYFTKLRQKIENAVESDNRNFVKRHPGMKNHVVSRGLMVIGHSMGNNIFRYFEKWIKYSMGVTAGKEWLATYINTFIAVGAPILGAQFSLQAAVSGLTFGLPITEYDARKMGLGYSSYGMVLPADPSHEDKRHSLLNNENRKAPIPVSSIVFPNGTEKAYNPSEGVWGLDIWKDIQEFDPWATYIQSYIINLYQSDPVINFEDSWRRPDVQNVYCVYGVNRKTPVSFKFIYPENGWENDWDTKEVIYEDHNRVYSDSGEEIFKYDPTRTNSGDGTVSYFSLSWCHTWMEERINITRIPQKDMYQQDEILLMRDTTIQDYVSTEIRTDQEYDTFFEERHLEPNGEIRSTAVWELDDIDHRAVIMEPVFLEQMSHQIHVQNNVVGKMEAQIEKMINTMISTISIFPKRGAAVVPTTDTECFWDYLHVKCAFPHVCGYYYKFGDYHLGMSCRLHKNHGSSIVLTEEDHKEVPCECMGGICYNGLCRYKSACKDSFLAPGLDAHWGRCTFAINGPDLDMLGHDTDTGAPPTSVMSATNASGKDEL